MGYQNIFTQVQVSAPRRTSGIALPSGDWARDGSPGPSYLMGKIGEPRRSGRSISAASASPRCLLGFLAFEIIGLNMWASVDWNPVQFVRQLPWLALEPPSPKYGLQIIPAARQGGWWLIAGFFMTASVLLWWARTFIRAKRLGLGTHTAWAFASAIFLMMSLGFIRPVLMGAVV